MTTEKEIVIEPIQILVLGNGFDLAQKLPTQYTDFMDFLRIEDPVKLIMDISNGESIDENKRKYFQDVSQISIDEIKRMTELRNHNTWVTYYLNCNAEIKGWIDLEREMLPAIDFFKWLFEQAYKMIPSIGRYSAVIETYEHDKYRIAKLFPEIVSRGVPNGQTSTIYVQPHYCDKQYGIFKEKILEKLKKNLDDFIEIFRIYLQEIAGHAPRENHAVINNLKADVIISFNYFQSETFLDNLKDAEAIHVHGVANIPNSMVLGVNKIKDDPDNDFIYFVKSFQRIRNKCNPTYREYWGKFSEVTFFGHSLDESDIDIIKPLYLTARKVRVYYYSEKDRESKIVNLIKMTSISKIEDDSYNGRLELLRSEQEDKQ